MTIIAETNVVLACPEWCTLAPDEHDMDIDASTVHYGPTFGMVEINQGYRGDGTPREVLHGATTDEFDHLEVEELRQLAADALAAAEWLEARQA